MIKVLKKLVTEGFLLLIEERDDQKRGYLFRDEGFGLLWPRAFGVLSMEEQVRLLKDEIDVYCVWSADAQMFGPWCWISSTEACDCSMANMLKSRRAV